MPSNNSYPSIKKLNNSIEIHSFIYGFTTDVINVECISFQIIGFSTRLSHSLRS
jgi:hypothetical protein